MCGIAGIGGIRFEDHVHPIHEMAVSLNHRGPDANGVLIDGEFALGHTRLSIIDLSVESNQPLWDVNNRYAIVFNGELYNYQEIKAQLNYPFKTRSDTEVILAAFIAWQSKCLEKFNGMFSFVIYDRINSSFFMARDRMGIKPLYYYLNDGKMVFASELRTIFKSQLVDIKLDQSALTEYLTYQSVQAPSTLIKGVRQLMPGHFGFFDLEGFTVHQYWQFDSKQIENSSITAINQNVKELFFHSVQRRMISDVPIGAFLSGGVDSSAIVAAMSRFSDRPVSTFSVVFEESVYDESKYSDFIAKKFKTHHNQVRLSPRTLLDELPDALDAMDNPTGDGINTYVVSKAARESGLTVALSGLGGDELFGGYPVFEQIPKLISSPIWKLNKRLRSTLAPGLSLFFDAHRRIRFKEMISSNGPVLNEIYPAFRKIFTHEQLLKLGMTNMSCDDVTTFSKEHNRIKSNGMLWSGISIAELTKYTQPVLLKDADQMSMAGSLEVRVPFLDHVLVEYVLNLPDEVKMGSTPKNLLINALENDIPKFIYNRPKKGFAFPWDGWIRCELDQFCQSQLQHLTSLGIFEAQQIFDIWEDFIRGRPKVHWTQVWLLVVLGYWCNKNLNVK